MQKLKKCFIILLFLILVIMNFNVPTYAVEKNDLGIIFITENNTCPMENVNIYIYKLASLNVEGASIEWNNIYNDFKLDLTSAEDKDIVSTANKLETYVKDNNVNCDYKLTTNKSGEVNVSLDNGIYFVCGDKTTKDNIEYTPVPCIMQLPYSNEDGSSISNKSIKLKYIRQEVPGKPNDPAPIKIGDTITLTPIKTGDTNLIKAGIALVIVVFLNIGLIILKRKKFKILK